MIWKNNPTIEGIQQTLNGTLSEHLGIEITEVGSDYIAAKMPVDKRTQQPYGILHGGASVVLSETLGSIASLLVLDEPFQRFPVGVEVNANHLRQCKQGYVIAKVRPIKIGKKIQVWETRIYNDENKLACISRLTTTIVGINDI